MSNGGDKSARNYVDELVGMGSTPVRAAMALGRMLSDSVPCEPASEPWADMAANRWLSEVALLDTGTSSTEE